MAIRLTEDVLAALLTIMAFNLAVELAAIDTERADGITLAKPLIFLNVYKYPKATLAGAAVFVEMYENGTVTFNRDSTDHQNIRATYTAPIAMRVTWFNRNGDTMDTMYKRARRYASGLVSLFAKNPQSSPVRHIRPVGVTISEVVATKGSVVVDLEVDCEETA